TVAAPVPPASVPRIVCHGASSGSGSVPSHASASGAGHAAPAVPAESTGRPDAPSVGPESSGPPFDPAPAVVKDGRDADAQIKLLQSYIKACQDAGICKR